MPREPSCRASAGGWSCIRTASTLTTTGISGCWMGSGATPNRPTRGHQVHKFSSEGELVMSLGTAGVKGADGPTTFNTPSDVLVAPNGDIFVADGHGGDNEQSDCQVYGRRDVRRCVGHPRIGTGPVCEAPTRWPWMRRGGCSWGIAGTIGFRSSTRTARSSTSGGSSGRRANYLSTRPTCSMSPTRPRTSPTTPATIAGSGSAAHGMGRSRPSCRTLKPGGAQELVVDALRMARCTPAIRVGRSVKKYSQEIAACPPWPACAHAHSRPPASGPDHSASGSGRIWNRTISLVVPLPPSI